MIIATAGHVDHGKTSLVKALTHIDTDRLDEEKRRGMTIDLGFAYADLGAGELLGFVDVPGHERFVRNMLAGVACIDLGLLAVAADDGPMPQTVEHLAILGLLGVPRCVVALTKIDRVTAQRVRQVEREIDALLGAGPFSGSALFPVVATSGAGVAALRQHLAEASRSLPARQSSGNFRLAIDRSFALAGAGRIVTGAVLCGCVRPGDRVVVSPAGVAARVRRIHVHDRDVEIARAGQRCALNLAGADLKGDRPARGDWVVAPAAHAPTDRLDVRLQVLAGEARALGQRAALQLHIGAATVNARAAALEGPAIEPGAAGWAQLLLDKPIAALHGDRFILRDPAASRSVAGGWIVDPFGLARGRSKPARIAQLAALALAEPAAALTALLDAEPAGVDLRRFALTRNLTQDEAASLQQTLHLERVEGVSTHWGFTGAQWQALRQRVCAELGHWHSEHPDSVGLGESALADSLGLRARAEVLRAVLASLLEDGAVQRDGLRCRLATHRAVLSAADDAMLRLVMRELLPGGLRAPIVGELATRLGVALPELLDFLSRASRLGQLVRVAPNRYYLPQTVAELARQARQLASESPDGSFDAAAFRDRTGIGRNLTVQVLEFMDRERLTRFDGMRRRPTDQKV